MSGMEHLIPLINELQNVFTAVGSSSVALPQLVVVGSQSSGKSSVLEHIVGRDFLPRGTGIVTRRPLILQLTHTPAQDDDEDEGVEAASNGSKSSGSSGAHPAGAEYGTFLHLPGQKFYDFDLIREEIARETDRVTGGGKGISSVALHLAIFSPHVLTLTLVDLPGISKIAVGDQPADIEALINAMILQYISSPHAIIVAVSAANADIANSDALKLAREVDPAGVRTLGVLTKIDLMDRGTDAMQVLNNSAGVELQHGFVGVVCRSQEAITQRRSIRDALAGEKAFFAGHPVYRSIAARLGTPFLARKLNTILMAHIQGSLPEIRSKIAATVAETQAELESYGDAAHPPDADRGGILLPLISKYCAHLSDALEGRSPDVSTTELYGGARISYIFTELFGSTLEAINPLDLLSDHDIRISIRNASGPRPALFIPEVAFELLVKKQIERLLLPALDCVDLVFHELQRVALQCELLAPELLRFPHLRARLLHVFQSLLRSCLEPTKRHIENLVQCELAFINTSHPDFIGGSQAVAVIMDRLSKMQQKQNAATAAGGATPDADLSSKLAGVTGNVSAAGSSAASSAGAKQPSYYGHSRSASSSPLVASSGPGAAISPATTASGTKGGFFQALSLWRSPSPLAQNTAPPATLARHLMQPGAPDRKRAGTLGYLQPASEHSTSTLLLDAGNGSTSSGGTTSGLDTMHEHELYSGSGSSTSSAGGASASSSVGGPSWHLRSLAPTERELIETEVIKILMSSYFAIVRKSIQDLVPKAIMCFLVLRLKHGIQAVLVRELYQPHLLDSLLQEAEDVAEKRDACKELLTILQRAMDILNTARDFNAMA